MTMLFYIFLAYLAWIVVSAIYKAAQETREMLALQKRAENDHPGREYDNSPGFHFFYPGELEDERHAEYRTQGTASHLITCKIQNCKGPHRAHASF